MHTRSLKYGKVGGSDCDALTQALTAQLRNGLLLTLSPRLIRRLKSHFHHLPGPNVDIILGLNGLVWIQKASSHDASEGFDAEAVYSNINDELSPTERKSIGLVAAIISAFANQGVPVSDSVIIMAWEWLGSRGLTRMAKLDREVEMRLVREVAGVEEDA